jgi:hypothetical protein
MPVLLRDGSNLSTASSSRGGAGGRTLFSAEHATGPIVLNHNEVSSFPLCFLCPDKESSHPIPLGRVKVCWTLAAPAGSPRPPPEWLSVTEVRKWAKVP